MRYGKNMMCMIFVFGITAGMVFSAADINMLLKRGVTSLTEEYDAVKARQDFSEMLDDPDAGEEIIIHAYFWMAYCYLFEGNNDAARAEFKKMYKYKTDADYKYESVLDQALLSNGELMRMYDVEFEKFYGRPRVIISLSDVNKRKFKAEKNFLMRGLIFGGIVVTVILISIL